MKKAQNVTRSSGNVFADAGIADAAEHMLKAQAVVVIMDEIQRQQLTQKEAGAIMGIWQSDVSRILRGDFANFGLERLLRFVRKLGRDVEIKIPRARSGREHHEGRLTLHAP
jgi:predicted XRE-type DNA-binding protein